jgi:hypothetical protein
MDAKRKIACSIRSTCSRIIRSRIVQRKIDTSSPAFWQASLPPRSPSPRFADYRKTSDHKAARNVLSQLTLAGRVSLVGHLGPNTKAAECESFRVRGTGD